MAKRIIKKGSLKKAQNDDARAAVEGCHRTNPLPSLKAPPLPLPKTPPRKNEAVFVFVLEAAQPFRSSVIVTPRVLKRVPP